MIETKKPKVILMTHTPEPKKAIALATHAWHADDFPEHMEDISDDYADKLATRAMTDFHSTALEYVAMTFVIKNVSRAFQQQLTRTRLAAYAIQSMRIVTKKGFAVNGHYTMPPGLTSVQQNYFHGTMVEIQYQYETMLKNGMDPQDARGALPLNAHSDISFTINFNALRHMMKQRLCLLTQHEYRQVALQIKQQIHNKMGTLFGDQFAAPCVKPCKCPLKDEYCGVPVWKLDSIDEELVTELFVQRKNLGKDGWDITWDGEPPEFKEA